MDEKEKNIKYYAPSEDFTINFNPDVVRMESVKTKRVLEIDINELMDLFLFVKKLKQGEDEIIKLLENRYENARELKLDGHGNPIANKRRNEINEK